MTDPRSPAEIAAQVALDQIYACIQEERSFILEAGAGAGKTHSLVMALRHLIQSRGRDLLRKNQRVACITYTNVARDEIISRTDGHPAILAETIHSFCWSTMRSFQLKLREEIPNLGGKWPERIAEFGEIKEQTVKYDLGYPKIKEEEIWLHHNDVLTLMVKCLEEPKFRSIFSKQFPILFIDEYQDTDKGFADSLTRHFVASQRGPLIGFFGDHWQRIYGSASCGKVEHPNLTVIEKKSNFRSEKIIVECLNKFRHELPQNVKDGNSAGSVTVFHTNGWTGTRRTGSHWEGDLPPDISHQFLENVRRQLTASDWDLSPEKTKVLMLTHNVLAGEQGYQNLAAVFDRTESYIKKEDDYIAFFDEVLEPVCVAYEKQDFGGMFSALSSRKLGIKKHSDKVRWATDMDELLRLRANGTIGDVVSHLKNKKLPRMAAKLEQKEAAYADLLNKTADQRNEDENDLVTQIAKLRAVPYKEVIALSKFIQDKTPFATKHGVKGAEFENVLVVFGRGWNQYNFGQMLEWARNGIPAGKQDTYERNRNLFYVACSRPKKRLAMLFTQHLSDSALVTLSNWFGAQNIQVMS